MRALDHIVKEVRKADSHNPDVQKAPVCILWPDRDRQWQTAIPDLKDELPELMVLGDYSPEKRTGPAIWLRCVIAGQVPDVILPKNRKPILYLPGVSRQDLRAIESCPDHLKPLAELQYRGVIWSQINGRDWTILAYLKSDQGGLGLDVAQDNKAKNAMQLALNQLFEKDVSLLKDKHLDKYYFNTLVTDDRDRELLQWLDQGDAFQAKRGENEWKTFIDLCESQLDFDPQNEGVLAGAALLANHKGPWKAVWERFCEAPNLYPNIPEQIRQCQTPEFDLFTDEKEAGGWPQWNDNQEEILRRDLMALANAPPHKARTVIVDLEKQHGGRRSLVWAKLGDAPLACALEHLAAIAEITKSGLAAGSVEDLVEGYISQGWRADDGVLRALAQVERHPDIEAVVTAIRSGYLPWMEESARHLQNLVDGAPYPGGNHLTARTVQFSSGDCVLFVDGLRFDIGKRLVEFLETGGFEISEEPTWAALPSVTATGKPAVTPVISRIRGEDDNSDFEPSVAETGQSLMGGYQLKKLLKDAGWKILEKSDNGDGQGMAWCEFGNIDREGHHRGCKLGKHIDDLIREIRGRIAQVLAAGWKRVRVVTDHGWLLMPGGLPKIELPSALTDNKWGRCASLKSGATTEERLYPWYWNPTQHFALADGVSCFRKGQEYTHGGLSLQECLTLQLMVTRGKSPQTGVSIEFTKVIWKGLRCVVAVYGNFSGLLLDVRSQAGDASTTMVHAVRAFKGNGKASVVVEDEDLEGIEATVVLIASDGSLVKQIATVIGGGSI